MMLFLTGCTAQTSKPDMQVTAEASKTEGESDTEKISGQNETTGETAETETEAATIFIEHPATEESVPETNPDTEETVSEEEDVSGTEPVSETEAVSETDPLSETSVTEQDPAVEEPVTQDSVAETVSSPAQSLENPDGVIDLTTNLYTYDQMVSDLNLLASAYPDRMRLGTIGTTADGRDIYVVYFGNPDADRQIFICAATHAREYMTAQLVMKQLEYYSAHYDTDSYNGQTYRQIFERTCFVVVPMVNPDGVTISQLGEAGIRSEALREGLRNIYNADVANGYTTDGYEYYLTRWKANARGVDLNRNYSPGWDLVTDRTAPSSTFYKGEYAGSEVEAQALMNVVNSLSNPRMAISYHSYGDLVYWQYGQSEPLWSANQNLATAISNLTGHYLAGYSNEAGFSNWCVLEKGIPSVTVETGTVPAPLPIDQFALLWSQHQYTWVMLGTYE
jgi:g-D-glutamyl-meso-diaminopimelate peptidase